MSKRPRLNQRHSREPAKRARREKKVDEGPMAGLLVELWGEVAGYLTLLDQMRLGAVCRRTSAGTMPFKGHELLLPRVAWENLRLTPELLSQRFAANAYTCLSTLPWPNAFDDPLYEWILASQTRVRDLTIDQLAVRIDRRATGPPYDASTLCQIFARLDFLSLVNLDYGFDWVHLATPTLRHLILQDPPGSSSFANAFSGVEAIFARDAGIWTLSNLHGFTKLTTLGLCLVQTDSDDDIGLDDDLRAFTRLKDLRVRQANPPHNWSPTELRDGLPKWLPALQTLDWGVPGHWQLTRFAGGPIEGRLFFEG